MAILHLFSSLNVYLIVLSPLNMNIMGKKKKKKKKTKSNPVSKWNKTKLQKN
jgi:hypothetical protein